MSIDVREAMDYLPDARVVADNLRDADVKELWELGRFTPIQGVRQSLCASVESYVGYARGTPACVFGVSHLSLMPDVGVPWMLGTNELFDAKRKLIAFSRRFVRHLIGKYSVLSNVVHDENEKSKAYLLALGFDMGDVYENIYGASVRRFTMKGRADV